MAVNSVQALKIWHSVAYSLVQHSGMDLSQRQLAILLEIYLFPPPHTVRGLATKLGVTKPVVTRALTALGASKLLSRKRDPDDGRNVLIQRTVEGSLFVENLGDILAASIEGSKV